MPTLRYDETGNGYFYFLINLFGILLLPITYYLWPYTKTADTKKSYRICQICCRKKREILDRPPDIFQKLKKSFNILLIAILWMIFIFFVYRILQFNEENTMFDPYQILGVTQNNSLEVIRKTYREKSLILHPDKETGSEEAFTQLTKAYKTLTNKEAYKNWQEHGDPDGPRARIMGIALPSWIVEKEYSSWVLGFYTTVFMLILPIIISIWWYRSIKYSSTKILIDTTKLYNYYIFKSSTLPMKRAISILSASFEFTNKYNPEVVTRTSDSEEIPPLLRLFPNVGLKNKEPYISYPYAVKSRVLIFAHLSRMQLQENTLDKDRQLVVRKVPHLITEMINCVLLGFELMKAKRISGKPNVENMEVCMTLSQMIVQSLLKENLFLMQLPHISEDLSKQLMVRKGIKSMLQLSQMSDEKRRSLLRELNDEEYEDMSNILNDMPYVEMNVKFKVEDDENPSEITSQSIVTVAVQLKRSTIGIVSENKLNKDLETDLTIDETHDESKIDNKVKKKTVAKKSSMKKSSKKTSSNKIKNKLHKKIQQSEKLEEESLEDEENPDIENDEEKYEDQDDDDDEEWQKIQQQNQKQKKMKKTHDKSHSVHCPYFPEDKQEHWWLYICNRKLKQLITAPNYVTDLLEEKEIELEFFAPTKPGFYTFSVHLKSDSYMGVDVHKNIKFKIIESSEITTDHPQWNNVDTEDNNKEDDDSSDDLNDDTIVSETESDSD